MTYNRLPEEVLVQIFAAVVTPLPMYASDQYRQNVPPDLFAALAEASRSTSRPKQRPFQWIAVTHVCRYWRAAALNYPKLWSNIIIDPNACPSHISLMFLNRASQSDLHVLVRLPPRHPVENPALEALISASDRIVGLYIPQSHDIALRFLEQPLPRLATLVYPNYHPGMSNALAKHSHLTTLRVNGGMLLPSSGIGHNLTCIFLASPLLDPSWTFYRSTLRFIDGCPLLEELGLARARLHPRAEDVEISAWPITQVARLKRLFFVGCDAKACFVFLQLLKLPREGVAIRVQGISEDCNLDLPRPTLSLSSLLPPTLLDPSQITRVRLQCSRSGIECTLAGDGLSLQLCVPVFALTTTDDTLKDFFASLITACGDDVTEAYFSTELDTVSSGIADLVREWLYALPKLSTLAISIPNPATWSTPDVKKPMQGFDGILRRLILPETWPCLRTLILAVDRVDDVIYQRMFDLACEARAIRMSMFTQMLQYQPTLTAPPEPKVEIAPEIVATRSVLDALQQRATVVGHDLDTFVGRCLMDESPFLKIGEIHGVGHVDYEYGSNLPPMALPTHCLTRRHDFWPNWNELDESSFEH